MDNALLSYFKEIGLNFKEYKHPAVFTVEESKFLKSKIPRMHTKSLFLKDNKSRFYLICMNAFNRLDIKSLQKYFHVEKLRFASAEELKEHLNITPGSVSIFGMIHDKTREVSLILDKEVWLAEIVGFHPNENTSTLEISHEDLKKFYESIESEKQIVDLER